MFYYNQKKTYFDRKRDEFLASISCGNFQAVERIYKEIFERIEADDEFSEIDQKAINQIQHVFRTFRKPIIENCGGNVEEIFKQTRKIFAKAVREQINNVKFVGYDQWRKKVGLSNEKFRVLMKTVATLQITVGCSVSCRRCNEWALTGPRKHFSFDSVTRLIKELFEAGNSEFVLYGASDPLDWKCDEKNIVDILAFMSAHGYQSRYGLLTKIPKGSQKVIESLLKSGADIGFSLTDKNRSKLEIIKGSVDKKLHIQHDTEDLLIPAGFDEDFSSIKSSVTDNYGCEITPEGAFFVIPTFTSALNLTGQRRIPITADTEFFLKKRVGRDALPVEYFKPLESIDLKGLESTLDNLLDAQIENIMLDNGSEELIPPGMMNMREYWKTYEPNAVKQRKSLMPAVAKGLIKDILRQEKYREDSREKRYSLFRQRVRDYFEICQMNNVLKYKKKAFSFYLESITGYLKRHPIERQIILYLRKEDRKKYDKVLRNIFKDNDFTVDPLLDDPNIDTFDLFQMLMFMLLDDPNNQIIQTLIEDNPVKTTDCFL